MVEQELLIEFSYSKESTKYLSILHSLVGFVVKKTNTNTHTSAWCVDKTQNTNAHRHARERRVEVDWVYW